MTTAAQKHAQRRVSAAARPAVDLVAGIGSGVIDQGPRPTCVPCAVAVAHEAERSGFQAAIEPIWWQLRQWGLADEFGTTLDSASRALPLSGQCESHLWPYNDSLGFDTEAPPHGAGAPPWHRAQLIPVRIARDGIEDEIEDELAARHPIVMGIEVGQDFLYPAPDGFIAVPDLQAQAAGYHAVLLVGAWTDPVYGRVFLVRNSWGVHWGAGGYGLLPVDYLVNFGTQAAKVEI